VKLHLVGMKIRQSVVVFGKSVVDHVVSIVIVIVLNNVLLPLLELRSYLAELASPPSCGVLLLLLP
jgi:hypothetical protein